MKPFNLEEAKQGKPIQYKEDGFYSKVELINRDLGGTMPLLFILTKEDKTNSVAFQTDLFGAQFYFCMKPTKKTIWFNLYKKNTYNIICEAMPHNSEESANRGKDSKRPRLGNKAYPIEIEE